MHRPKPKAKIGLNPAPLLSLDCQGRLRTFALYLPPKIRKDKRALVLVFHGGLSNSDYAARMSDMNAKADQEGFVVAYPNGSGEAGAKALTWNAWNCCGYAVDHQVDDVRFIASLIDHLVEKYAVDSKKVYATGFSNGAMMCHRIAVEIGNKITAIAPVAGAFNADLKPSGEPVSVMMIHGEEDLHVQIKGGVPQRTFAPSNRVDKPLSHAVNYWVERDGCGKTAAGETRGNAHFQIYSGGRGNTEVQVCFIKGQGHSWPGGKQGLHYGNIDAPVQDVSATDLMWDFFKDRQK